MMGFPRPHLIDVNKANEHSPASRGRGVTAGSPILALWWHAVLGCGAKDEDSTCRETFSWGSGLIVGHSASSPDTPGCNMREGCYHKCQPAHTWEEEPHHYHLYPHRQAPGLPLTQDARQSFSYVMDMADLVLGRLHIPGHARCQLVTRRQG